MKVLNALSFDHYVGQDLGSEAADRQRGITKI